MVLQSSVSEPEEELHTNHIGGTPLMVAITEGKIDALRSLLSNPEIARDVTYINQKEFKSGLTALHYACLADRADMIHMLLDFCSSSIDVIALNYEGQSAVHVAAMTGRTKALDALLERITDYPVIKHIWNEKDILGHTPLYSCAMMGHLDCMRRLMGIEGVDPNYCNEKGFNMMHACCVYNREECLKLVLRHPDADINLKTKDSNACTPLMIACANGSIDTVKELLLLKSLDLNAQNCEGNTAFHLAAYLGKFAILELLIKAHARFNIALRNKDGKMFMEYCLKENVQRLIEVLKKFPDLFNVKVNVKEPQKVDKPPVDYSRFE